jgi:hypothetical protein
MAENALDNLYFDYKLNGDAPTVPSKSSTMASTPI